MIVFVIRTVDQAGSGAAGRHLTFELEGLPELRFVGDACVCTTGGGPSTSGARLAGWLWLLAGLQRGVHGCSALCSGAGAHWIGADVELAEGAVEAAPMHAAQVPWDMGQSPVLHKEG